MSFYLGSRVQRLERKQQRKAANPLANYADYFKCIPTCPPTTSVYITSGLLYRNEMFWFWLGYNVNQPERVCDFSDPEVSYDEFTDIPLTCNFTNADYYLGIILGYNIDYVAYDDGVPFLCSGTQMERETSAEAEADIGWMLNGGGSGRSDLPYYWDRFPIWAIVLRNNGIIGQDGQVLPVDATNRGRSYLFRDVRWKNPAQS